MEDTIGSRMNGTSGQVFRITYKQTDFQVKVINGVPKKDNNEIEILLDGLVQTLVKQNDRWIFADIIADQEFANNIGRAISLRYRL